MELDNQEQQNLEQECKLVIFKASSFIWNR